MKNFKEDNLTGKNKDGVNPNTPLQFLTASSIIGDEVVNKNTKHMGNIMDLMIDLETGKIEYVVVELGGFLGIGEKYFAFPYALFKVDPVNQTFVLDKDIKDIENAPGFDKEHWPETNSHLYSDSTSYWGGFIGANTGGVPY